MRGLLAIAALAALITPALADPWTDDLHRAEAACKAHVDPSRLTATYPPIVLYQSGWEGCEDIAGEASRLTQEQSDRLFVRAIAERIRQAKTQTSPPGTFPPGSLMNGTNSLLGFPR